MSGLLYALEITQNNLVRIIAIGVLCAVCLAVLIASVVMFVRSDKKARSLDKAEGAGATAEASDTVTAEGESAETAPAESAENAEVTENAESAETVGETAPAAKETTGESAAADAPEEEQSAAVAETEAAATVTEEAAAEKPAKRGRPKKVAADEDEEDEDFEPPVDVAAEGRDIPAFMSDILAALSEPSAELLRSYTVERRLSRMKDIWAYSDEKAFVDDFFRNSIRFKCVMNEEIYTLLYERARRGKRGDALSKLRMKYVNALYRYSKDEPELVERCVELLKDDVRYQFDVVGAKNTKVPSVKKLVIIYTAQERYREAVNLCDKAIERNLYDVRQTTFRDRRDRLLAQIGKL